MKLTFKFVLVILCAAFILLPVNNVPAQQSGESKAWIIPIRGDIEPSMAAFVRREARKAINANTDYIIFEIDTFGGRVDTALQIASFIMSIRNARTVAWIQSGESSMGVSWSAGALIAFSCSEIFMAPGTSIGAAAPVTMSTDGSTERADEKTVSAVRAQMAALAERNNHPVDIALAMVDFDVELWEVYINGEMKALSKSELERLDSGRSVAIERIRIISSPGKLLSLTAGEASRYGLAQLAADQATLLATLGVFGGVEESIPGIADSIISFLTSGPVQTVLIILGIILLFMELNSPGFGIPGIIGVFCFLLVFGSGALLGRVDSLEIILFLVGIGFLAIEIFALPGFGVMGVAGILIIGFSLVFSMQDFVIPRFDWEWELLGRNVLVVFAGLLSAITGIAIIALMGPRIKIFDRIMLKTQITGTAGGPDPDSPAGKATANAISDGSVSNSGGGYATEDEEMLSALTGKIGVTDSVLRPSGKAVFDGKVYAVEADGEFVEAGRGIIVTRVRGNRIIVRRV